MDAANILVIDHTIAQLSVAEAALIGPGKRIKSTVNGVVRRFEFVSGNPLLEASYQESALDFSEVQNAPITSTQITVNGADGSSVILTCVAGKLTQQGITP